MSKNPSTTNPFSLGLLDDRGMMASQRAAVSPWECDRMGHLNVQFYLARAADAEAQVFGALGLPAHRQKESRIGVRALEHRLIFKREMHVSDVSVGRSGIREAGPDGIRIFTELTDFEAGHVTATIEATYTGHDFNAGRDCAFPDDVAARASAMAAAFRGPAEAASQGAIEPPPLPTDIMGVTCKGMVNTWESDIWGRLGTRFHMGIFSNAVGNLLLRAGLDIDAIRLKGWGSAALDYRIRYAKPLHTGLAFTVYSAPLEIREKVWRFCHIVTDSANGEKLFTAEVVALLFDLKTRKSFPIPDEVRAHLAPLVIGQG